MGPSDDDESLPEETPIQKEASVICIPEKSSKKRKSANRKGGNKSDSSEFKLFQTPPETKKAKTLKKNSDEMQGKKHPKLAPETPLYGVYGATYKDSFGVRAVYLSEESASLKNNDFLSEMEERYSGTTKLQRNESLKKLCLKSLIPPGSVVDAEMEEKLGKESLGAQVNSSQGRDGKELRKIPVSKNAPKFR